MGNGTIIQSMTDEWIFRRILRQTFITSAINNIQVYLQAMQTFWKTKHNYKHDIGSFIKYTKPWALSLV